MNRYERELAESKREWDIKINKERIRELERQVTNLTKALEWHVGCGMEVILAEQHVVKVKIAERKRLIEETGGTDLIQDPGPTGAPMGGDPNGQSPEGL
jgi:hypothetical protein